MSISSNKVAIVSIGISCQTAYQIRNHKEYIKELLNLPDICESTYPFDWVICPPENILCQIDSSFFPQSPDELERRSGVVCWPSVGVYYWNDFHSGDINANFEDIGSKFSHLNQKWGKLCEFDKVIFVLSNTQNNLPIVSPGVGGFNWKFKKSVIIEIREKIMNFMPGCMAEGFVVTYPDRCDSDVLDGGWPVYFLKQDESAWEGDAVQWRQVIYNYMKSR
jgi:hypothetical protein